MPSLVGGAEIQKWEDVVSALIGWTEKLGA